MPSINTIKEYTENGIYHVYNRGNNGQKIFHSDDDFLLFLQILVRYLRKPLCFEYKVKNYMDKVEILAFCLMENHFHLLLRQVSSNKYEIAEFMQSLALSYFLNIKSKHNKKGHLFESRYKARLIKSEYDLINISKYIHMNPSENYKEANRYPYSSVRCYTNYKRQSSYFFIKTDEVLRLFSTPYGYVDFLRN